MEGAGGGSIRSPARNQPPVVCHYHLVGLFKLKAPPGAVRPFPICCRTVSYRPTSSHYQRVGQEAVQKLLNWAARGSTRSSDLRHQHSTQGDIQRRVNAKCAG